MDSLPDLVFSESGILFFQLVELRLQLHCVCLWALQFQRLECFIEALIQTGYAIPASWHGISQRILDS